MAKSEVEHERYTCIQSFTSTRECNWEDIADRCQQYCTAHSDMAAQRPGIGQVVMHVMMRSAATRSCKCMALSMWDAHPRRTMVMLVVMDKDEMVRFKVQLKSERWCGTEAAPDSRISNRQRTFEAHMH